MGKVEILGFLGFLIFSSQNFYFSSQNLYIYLSLLEFWSSGFNTDYGSSEPLKTLVMLCYVSCYYFVTGPTWSYFCVQCTPYR